MLPHTSVAVNVRSMTLLPSHGKDSESENVTSTSEQASVAVAISKAYSALQSKSWSAGVKSNDGGVRSYNVITWSLLVLFPQASVTVQVRVMTLLARQLSAFNTVAEAVPPSWMDNMAPPTSDQEKITS